MEKSKEAYIKEQREKINKLNESIKDLVNGYHENPENLVELVQFQSKFYQYSYQNRLLIYKQNRGAAFVGSYDFFKQRNYAVRKGQKGIKILVPIFGQYFKAGKTEKAVKYATKEETEQIKKGQIKTYKKLSHFRIGHVYDISQTTCPVEEYPKFYHMGYESKEHHLVYQGLKEFSEKYQHRPVEEKDINSIALRGYYVPVDKIVISEMLKDTEKVSTLSHEIGHDLVYGSQNEEKLEMQEELKADIMSVMLQTHLGIEITEGRKRHLTKNYKEYESLWKEQAEKKKINSSEKELPSIEDIINDVAKEYEKNIGKIDECIEHQREEIKRRKAVEERKEQEDNQKEDLIQAGAAGAILYGMNQEYIAFQDEHENLILGEKSHWDEKEGRYDNRSETALIYPEKGFLAPVLEKDNYEFAKKYGYLSPEDKDIIETLGKKIRPVTKVKIYQVKEEKMEYLFRSLSSLKEKGLDIQKENYKLVAEFDLPKEKISINRQLERVFEMGNTGELQAKAHPVPMRSISVSDIVMINQDAYYVDNIGFSEVRLEEKPEEKRKVASLLEEKDKILKESDKLQKGSLEEYLSRLPEKKFLLESLEAFKKEEPAMAGREKLELPQLRSEMPQIQEFIKEMEENPGMIRKADLGAILIGTSYGSIRPAMQKSRNKVRQKSKKRIFQKGIVM